MPFPFPANLSTYNTDTSRGRSPLGNGGYTRGRVQEFYLLEADNTGVLRPLLLHSCRQPPDFLLQHHRLKFHTLGSSSSSSQKNNGREEFCRSLFKRPRGKTFSRTFATKIKPPDKTRREEQFTDNFSNFSDAKQLRVSALASAPLVALIKFTESVSPCKSLNRPTINQVSRGFSSTTHLLSYTNNNNKKMALQMVKLESGKHESE